MLGPVRDGTVLADGWDRTKSGSSNVVQGFEFRICLATDGVYEMGDGSLV